MYNYVLFSQNIAITDDDSYSPDSTAILDIKAINKGLLIPRINFNFRPINPANGLLIYVTANGPQGDNAFYFFDGNNWKKLDIYSNSWSINGNAEISDTNYIGTINNKALKFKVNSNNSGIIDPNGQTFLGYQSGLNNTNNRSLGLGYQSLSSGNSGDYNVGLGYQALQSNTTGAVNTAVGALSMKSNSTGNWCSAFGNSSLTNNTIGTHNTAIGALALNSSNIASYNTSLGYGSIMENISGNSNTGIGMYSFKSLKTGSNNTAIGVESGYNLTNGSGNVFLGYKAGYNETGSNKLYIANSETNPPLIFGDFSTSRIGLGLINPSKDLTIKGDIQIQTKGSWVAGAKARLYLGEDDNIWVEHIHSTGLNLNTADGWNITFKDGNQENMRIIGNGNVGIGTTSPNEKFVVLGNHPDGRIATFQNSFDEKYITLGNVAVDQGGYLKYKASSNYTGIGVHGHAEQLIVNSLGNVGIGTTSPTAKLQVETYGVSNKTILGINSVLIQNQTPSSRTLLALAPNGTQNADFVIFHNSDYTTNYEGMIFGYENTLNNFIIGSFKGGTGTARSIVMDATGAGSPLWEQLVIATNGNVGIGNSTPSAKLDIVGDLKVSGNIYAPGTVVQTIVKTSELTSIMNTTSFTEVNPDYRITITPKYANSIILIEYNFSINTDMTSNTVFQMQLVRNIGGTEQLVGVGPINGDRNRASFVSRPNNGTDSNDMQNVYMIAKDTGLNTGVSYTYGFKYRRENGGMGDCYFNYNASDSSVFGFSGIMTIKATEIAQ